MLVWRTNNHFDGQERLVANSHYHTNIPAVSKYTFDLDFILVQKTSFNKKKTTIPTIEKSQYVYRYNTRTHGRV